jgi:hypothetical protein
MKLNSSHQFPIESKMSSVQHDSTSSTSFGAIPFVDRRQRGDSSGNGERRQFGNSYNDLSAEGKELAEAIDAYKVQHRRRYVTTDELLQVLKGLGYSR